MYTKRILTPEEIESLDWAQVSEKNWARFTVETRGPVSPYYRYLSVEELAEHLNRQQWRVQAYIDWNRKYLEKYQRQGGTNTKQFVLDYVSRTYVNSLRHVTPSRALEMGRDYLIARIKAKIEQYGYPQTQFTVARHRTAASLPCGGQKGTFLAESSVDSSKLYPKFYPAIPGYRFTKGKPRIIYQDSIVNVRYTEKTLSGCKNWLRNYFPEYFSKWIRDDIVLNPMITDAVDHNFAFGEFDYYHMDEHFSQFVVDHYVLPIYEVLLPQPEFSHLVYYCDYMWEQPLLCGPMMLSGKHNLFSGQNPTNDFETLVSIMFAIGTALLCDINPMLLVILACGDDLSFGLPRKYSSVVRRMLQVMAEEANAVGLVVSPDKLGYCEGYVHFCKKLYAPGLPRDERGVLIGAYPSVLAVNSIMHPESVSPSPGMSAVADLQRLSNLVGSPDFNATIQLIGRRRTNKEWDFSESDINRYTSKDWWQRVYGEDFNPDKSPAFIALKRNSIIK